QFPRLTYQSRSSLHMESPNVSLPADPLGSEANSLRICSSKRLPTVDAPYRAQRKPIPDAHSSGLRQRSAFSGALCLELGDPPEHPSQRPLVRTIIARARRRVDTSI
ncbi:unnamed protein product, partial [Laminaria digitata]